MFFQEDTGKRLFRFQQTGSLVNRGIQGRDDRLQAAVIPQAHLAAGREAVLAAQLGRDDDLAFGGEGHSGHLCLRVLVVTLL